jgi:hypothetical protein
LIVKFPGQKDWVSFSGHGVVMSFDEDLIARQNERKIDNLPLAQDLGFAEVNSVHGKVLDVFYRQSFPM